MSMSDQRKSALARMAGNIAGGLVTLNDSIHNPYSSTEIAAKACQVAFEIMDKLDKDQALLGNGVDVASLEKQNELRKALREACSMIRRAPYERPMSVPIADKLEHWEKL
jgi:hypothetical protein